VLHIGRRTFTFSRSLTSDQRLDGIKDKIRTSFGYYPCKRRRLMWKHLLRLWRSIKRTVHLQSDLSCSRRPNLRDSDLSAHKRIFLNKLRLLWLIFWRKFLSLKVKNFCRSHNNAKLISAFAFLPTIISQTLRRFAKIRWRISWETGLSRAKTCSCWCNISLNVVLQRCYGSVFYFRQYFTMWIHWRFAKLADNIYNKRNNDVVDLAITGNFKFLMVDRW